MIYNQQYFGYAKIVKEKEMISIPKCKNCGHEVWYRFEGLVHKYSNNIKCSGDGKDIINCPCPNPESKGD